MVINILLFIASIIIYASFGITNLIYIGISAISTYLAARNLKGKHKKIIFWAAIILNAGILIFFKIFAYGKTNNWGAFNRISILAPLGVAYYTLQVISYLVDVYKEKCEPEKNLFNYLLYVMYIPYLFIGPISRYNDIKDSLFTKRKIKLNNLLNGSIRILWGLAKKLIIAGRISIIIATITSDSTVYTGPYVFLALLLYSIQLYSDFSGGIDIVIGVSKMLGISIKENFDSPYLSENLKEFWRKWHIALSSWLRDYIYIPLGGNRCSRARQKINLIATFVVSGLWHGLNYFLWGLIHGILVAFYNVYQTKWKSLNRVINFILVSLLWCFFIWPNSIIALKMVGTIFTNFNYIGMFSNLLNLGLNLPNLIVLIISVICLTVFDIKKIKIIDKIKNLKVEWKLIIIAVFVILVLVFGIYGIGFNVSEFIYSKF